MGTQNNSANVGNFKFSANDTGVKYFPQPVDSISILDSATSNNPALAAISTIPLTGGGGIPNSLYPPALSGSYALGTLLPAAVSNITSWSTLAPLTGTIYYMPFVLAYPIALSQIVFNCTTLKAGESCNVCLYNSNAASTLPTGNPITNTTSGSVSCTTTGTKATALAAYVPLNPGMYFVALATSDTTGTLKVACHHVLATNICNATTFGSNSVTTITSAITYGYTEAFTYSTTMPTVGSPVAITTLTPGVGFVVK